MYMFAKVHFVFTMSVTLFYASTVSFAVHWVSSSLILTVEMLSNQG